MTNISVGFPKVLLHLLHCPGELVQGSRSKIEDVAVKVTAPALTVVIGFEIRNLGLGTYLLTSVPIGLGCLYLAFFSQSF